MLVGYARVSTTDQSLDLQKDTLQAAGCEKLFEDVLSGARQDRPGMKEALAYVRTGDALLVWKQVKGALKWVPGLVCVTVVPIFGRSDSSVCPLR